MSDALLQPPRTRLRRSLTGFAFALLVTPYALYQYFTSDEYIRAQAIHALADATGAEVRIGHAHFSLFGGTLLENVQLLTPADADFAAPLHADDPLIFSAGAVELIHEPWPIFFGKLRIRRIVASAPTFTVVYNAD